jgi:hypothetical protein
MAHFPTHTLWCHPLTNYLVRLIVYSVCMVVVVLVVTAEGYLRGPAAEYSEHSILEYSQTVLLLITAALFYTAARCSDHWRVLCIGFTFAALIAAVREQDTFLDRWLFDGAWQCLVFGLVVGLAVYLKRRGRGLGRELNTFVETRAAGLLAAGFLIVFVFSRLFGKQTFWKAVMGEGYQRVVKNIVEEGVELLGYSLLTMAAGETWMLLRQRARPAG